MDKPKYVCLDEILHDLQFDDNKTLSSSEKRRLEKMTESKMNNFKKHQICTYNIVIAKVPTSLKVVKSLHINDTTHVVLSDPAVVRWFLKKHPDVYATLYEIKSVENLDDQMEEILLMCKDEDTQKKVNKVMKQTFIQRDLHDFFMNEKHAKSYLSVHNKPSLYTYCEFFEELFKIKYDDFEKIKKTINDLESELRKKYVKFKISKKEKTFFKALESCPYVIKDDYFIKKLIE